LCKIIEFFNTQTLLEITLLEHRAWTAPIEAALASPTVFRNHFPWVEVDEYSLKHAHDVGPPYGPPFTFTGHFQGLLRLAAKNKYAAPSRDYIFDKWPDEGFGGVPAVTISSPPDPSPDSNLARDNQSQGRQRHSTVMYIHVCRACGCTFRCVVIKSVRMGDECSFEEFDECHCLKAAMVSSAATFCSNSCYWDCMRPGGVAIWLYLAGAEDCIED
jgi:hypothetical protein